MPEKVEELEQVRLLPKKVGMSLSKEGGGGGGGGGLASSSPSSTLGDRHGSFCSVCEEAAPTAVPFHLPSDKLLLS